jgi:serine/threonine-protein kinase
MVHELLMALDHAHRQNVVHRDIKPANMLMEVTGRIKLTDFGVARIQEPDETNLTQVGGAVGTPKYMSPEQARGLRGDSRSDLFSAAVVLYELLTGTLPFTGENQFTVIHQIVSHEAKAPSSLNPEVPVEMDEVLVRAMAKNPDERYATARDFALALRGVAQHMNASSGTQGGADVAAELGQFLANRPAPASVSLRDGSSTGIFGPSLDVALNTTVNHEAELGAWNAVKDSTNAQDFLGFLARFPAGIYARRAQSRVYQLGAGDALQDAKTVPQFRAEARDSGFESTVGSYEPTKPLQTPDPVVPAVQKKASIPVKQAPVTKDKTRKPWPLVIGSTVLVGVIALFLIFKPGGPEVQTVKSLAAPTPVKSASAELPSEPLVRTAVPAMATPPVPQASAPVAIIASRPAPTAVAAASKPVVSKPKPGATTATPAVVQPHPAQPSSVQATAAPTSPVPPRETASPVASATHGNGHGPGPSMAGQVCAERVFIFKIACIAEQCTTDRYRQTSECIRFKDMEREREEQRNSRR